MKTTNLKNKLKLQILIVLIVLGFAQSINAQNRIIPSDPYFKYQVSYENDGGECELPISSINNKMVMCEMDSTAHMNIVEAWKTTTGSKDVVVAVMDDGFFYNHEDIRDNIWQNKGEIGLDENGFPKATNGKDDDGNGYIDDVMGYDFAFNDPDPDCYIFDGRDESRIQPYWHSIHALGIIGARGNNGIGVAGINWDISLMLLKMCAQGNDSQNRIKRAAQAITYAIDNGAKIINWSGHVRYKSPSELQVLQDAIDYAEDKKVLIVVAAGNSKKNLDILENESFPTCFKNKNILTVAEVDFDGRLYAVPENSKWIGGSNFGMKTVDIAAIAQNFTTEFKYNVSLYRIGGGTSNATPAVTGIAALVASVRPDLNGIQIKEILMQSVTKKEYLKDKLVSGGIVNAGAAVELAIKYNEM